MSVKGSRCEAAFFYRSTVNGQQTNILRRDVTPEILSCLRHFYCLWFLDLQAFRTTCSIPAWELSSFQDFF